MDKAEVRLTVFFEGVFWVAVFEKLSNGGVSVAKVTFGAEPREQEVLEYILEGYSNLVFSPAVEAVEKKQAKNPKRLQRQVQKQIQNQGIGTKSQKALQLQREEMKVQKRQMSKAQKEAEKQRLYELKQQKRKEKHRGR